jgi:hypothetical protein
MESESRKVTHIHIHIAHSQLFFNSLEKRNKRLLFYLPRYPSSNHSSCTPHASISGFHTRALRGHTRLYRLTATASIGLIFPSNVALK